MSAELRSWAAALGNGAKASWLWGTRKPFTEECPAWLYLRRARGYQDPIPPTVKCPAAA